MIDVVEPTQLNKLNYTCWNVWNVFKWRKTQICQIFWSVLPIYNVLYYRNHKAHIQLRYRKIYYRLKTATFTKFYVLEILIVIMSILTTLLIRELNKWITINPLSLASLVFVCHIKYMSNIPYYYNEDCFQILRKKALIYFNYKEITYSSKWVAYIREIH